MERARGGLAGLRTPADNLKVHKWRNGKELHCSLGVIATETRGWSRLHARFHRDELGGWEVTRTAEVGSMCVIPREGTPVEVKPGEKHTLAVGDVIQISGERFEVWSFT